MNAKFKGSLLLKLVLPVPLLLIVALWTTSYLVPTLTADNARREAIRDATQTVSQFKTLRAYYTEKVVDKVLRGSELKASIDHAGNMDSIPLPATFIHDMSDLLQDQDTSIALYSGFPFPNRAERQLDAFEIEAWAFLTTNPNGVFWRQGVDEDGDFVRVALADRMVAQACVDCHNSHLLSPWTDWKIGDVRGVLEVKAAITAPLAAGQALSNKIMGGAAVIALLLIAAIVIIANRVVVPLTGITGAMQQLAEGDQTVAVPGLQRGDEVGAMARAVQFFKDNAIKLARVAEEKRELESKAEEEQRAAEERGRRAVERKKAEKILEAKSLELKRSNEDLEKFAHIASHDLKAPLRSIASLVTWITEDLGEAVTGETTDHLRLMGQRVKRMEAMLDALLLYSKVGSAKYTVERIDTSELVCSVVELTGIPEGFEVEVAKDMPVLLAQRAPLELVFRNLVSNALKHHDRATGKITITGKVDGNCCKFTVSDDGPGIPEIYQQKIFEMFETLKSRDEVEGSGIGLALVKKTVERNNGVIKLVSQERGAAFSFTWENMEKQGSGT
jgi:signal transduction histidine kinase